jgi:hypothetical protein
MRLASCLLSRLVRRSRGEVGSFSEAGYADTPVHRLADTVAVCGCDVAALQPSVNPSLLQADSTHPLYSVARINRTEYLANTGSAETSSKFSSWAWATSMRSNGSRCTAGRDPASWA